MGRDLITYLVSGHMRTGTSMMMGALIDGGLEPLYDPNRDNLNKRHGDELYTPNPAYYEPSTTHFSEPDWPRKHEGKLIKVLHGGIAGLAPLKGKIKVVFMWRDPEEIRQSYEGFFSPQKAPPGLSNNGYKIKMDLALDRLRNRKDVDSIHEFNYRDVVNDPVESFARLRDDGWPIDIDKAAAHVNPDLYRYRIENLVVGL